VSIDKNGSLPWVDSEDEQFRTAISSLREEDIPPKDAEDTASVLPGTHTEVSATSPRARCELLPRAIRQYPAQRPGTTSKDRRYMAKRVKATDQGKSLGKRPGPSGKSYQQIKSEDFPHSDV